MNAFAHFVSSVVALIIHGIVDPLSRHAAFSRYPTPKDILGRSRLWNLGRALSLIALGGFVLATICPPSVRAQTVTATLAAGTTPWAIAVNPVTNTIYVVNSNSNNVTVIDGATNATATVTAGSFPDAIAVNPVTNMIYVACANYQIVDTR